MLSLIFWQINIVQGIVTEINIKTGESECDYYKERLIYLEDCQRDPLIDNSRALCCHGELKNNRGAVSNLFNMTLFSTQYNKIVTYNILYNPGHCF